MRWYPCGHSFRRPSCCSNYDYPRPPPALPYQSCSIVQHHHEGVEKLSHLSLVSLVDLSLTSWSPLPIVASIQLQDGCLLRDDHSSSSSQLIPSHQYVFRSIDSFPDGPTVPFVPVFCFWY